MVSASALSAHSLMTILGEGVLLFAVSLVGLVVPWFGKPVSRKTYLLLNGAMVTIWMLIAAVFALRR